MSTNRRLVSRRLRPIVFSLLLLAGATGAQAQGSTDGSVYSAFGIGELRSFSSSQAQALGGGGTALVGLSYVNAANPATYSDQLLTRASLGAMFQTLQSTNAQSEKSELSQGNLNAVQFSFPILTRKLGVGVSFEPFSRMNYHIQQSGRVEQDPVLIDTTTYTIDFVGNGGLQQIVAGLGYQLNDRVSVGASAHLVFGVLEETRTTSFSRLGFSEAQLNHATRLAGYTGTAGVTANFPRLLGRRDILFLGASVTLPSHLTGNRVRTLGDDLDADTLGSRINGSVDIPMTVRLGASYRPDDRWLLLVDGLFEPWSSFESDFVLNGYDPAGGNQFNDRVRTSGGVEFIPAGGDMNASFFSRTAYRLGAYFDRSYVSPQNGYTLNTMAVTGGISLPSIFPGTRVDLNAEVGSRGTTDRGLVRDVFFRLGANVSIGERWFERRRLR